MEFLVFLVILGGVIGIGILARKDAQPKLVKIQGPVPHPDLWMPQALDSACKWSVRSWTWQLSQVEKDDGTKVGDAEIRTTEGELIRLRFPLEEAKAGEFLLVHVAIEQFTYRRGPLIVLLIGKYPETHLIRMRRRLRWTMSRAAKKAREARAA